jgi:hypothetical protein
MLYQLLTLTHRNVNEKHISSYFLVVTYLCSFRELLRVVLVLYVIVDHLRVVRSCCRLHDMHALPNLSTEILLVAHFAYFTKSDS